MNREFSKSFRLHTSLMARILLGEYRDGDFLPSAGELADEFSVSIATVKRVLDVLAASNLIRRRNGRSPVVRLKSDYRNSVCKQLRVVVVFDGYKRKGNPGEKFTFHNIQVVYTAEGETGDAYIEGLLEKIGPNYNVRVATSDGLVQLSSIRSGVLRVSARELREELLSAQQEMKKHFRK